MEASTINFETNDSPFALFAVDDVVYGVSSSNVLSIEILQKPTPLVNAPVYTLGILDFRGDMIPLIGLRKLFGKSERGAGLRRFMQSNAAEHSRWMDEMTEAYRQNRAPQGLSFDPVACALGRWLSNFTSQSSTLNLHVQKMLTPHHALYEEGAKLSEAIRKGEKEKADRLFEELSAHYSTLSSLIETTADAYIAGVREMLLVLNVGDVTKGIVVDDIVSVEYVSKFVDLPGSGSQSKYVKMLAKRDKDDSTVLLMDEELIITL